MMEEFPLKEETYKIIGICMEVQRVLGFGFSEVIYKDAIEIELETCGIEYVREPKLTVSYKGRQLHHRFYADFISYQRIIVEIKSSESGISTDCIAQVLNYLRVSGNMIGLIVNFGKRKLEYKRLILSGI
jgi:GxxExxY protein